MTPSPTRQAVVAERYAALTLTIGLALTVGAHGWTAVGTIAIVAVSALYLAWVS